MTELEILRERLARQRVELYAINQRIMAKRNEIEAATEDELGGLVAEYSSMLTEHSSALFWANLTRCEIEKANNEN